MADMTECNLLLLQDSAPALEIDIPEREEETEVELTTEDVKDYDIEIFIEVVKQFECLWNTSLASYKDRNCKLNAWEQIGKMFNKDVEFLKQEFKRLKDNLKKCLDRREKATKSGAPYSKLPQCKYFSQLLFLTDKTANKPTVSNVAITINESGGLGEKSASSEIQPTTSTPTKRNSVPQACTNDNINIISQSHGVEAQACSASAKKMKPSPACENLASQSKKSRAEFSHAVDSMLVKTLQDMQKKENKSDGLEKEDDEDSLYCRSLIPVFRQLPLKKKRLAKMKIDELLYTIEFESH